MESRFRVWTQRFFADHEMVLLFSLIFLGILLLILMGNILAPVVISIMIAYLLQSPVRWLQRASISPLWAVCLVYSVFLGMFLVAILVVFPIIFQQLLRLYAELPTMITAVQHFLLSLPEKYPALITKNMVNGWIDGFVLQLHDAGKMIFTASLVTLPRVVALVMYLFLVPLMVFFFLKDDVMILRWGAKLLPKEHTLIAKVWLDIDKQIVNYIRGKAIESALVFVTNYIVFYFFDLHYAFLLAVLVGVSIFIPYIGIIIVTVPVVLVAFFHWGFSAYWVYFLLTYGIVQAIDGAVLVPILFGEVVNLHPIAIIVATLVFGAWWGVWGVFLAIPLATVVKVMLNLRLKPIE